MRPGDIVHDRFELERLAGAGGMGEVFRARDREGGGVVALKILLADTALDVARFEREARLLSRLSHPGIVRYITHSTAGSGERYLAMEWLEGEDLAKMLARGRLTVSESLTLVARAASALGAAHARGVVHRDLKPSNIFLVGGDVAKPKILDFGIASLTGGTRVTRTGAAVGTPGFMAPEQARSRQNVDARADVFALGCVLFECLTGTPAFTGDHVMAVLAKILFDDAPRARELCPELPEELDDLRGLAVRAARPGDPRGLQHSGRRAARGAPEEA
jgi:eukaryotic-like serine/threonine-protein kinase